MNQITVLWITRETDHLARSQTHCFGRMMVQSEQLTVDETEGLHQSRVDLINQPM